MHYSRLRPRTLTRSGLQASHRRNFGAAETLWRAWTVEEFVPKTHPSSLVLGLGLLLATLVSGAASCGWRRTRSAVRPGYLDPSAAQLQERGWAAGDRGGSQRMSVNK